jgi:hypothetical protein
VDDWLYENVDNREDYTSAEQAVANRYKLRTFDSGSFALQNRDESRWREFVDSYLEQYVDGDRKTWQRILLADLAVTSLMYWLFEDVEDGRTVTLGDIQIAESYMTRMRTDRVLSAFVREWTVPNDPGSILPETYLGRELALKLGFWEI